jgi:hypothetical protein
MASFKWKKIPIFESLKYLDNLKVIKYIRVNRLSNHQLLTFTTIPYYKDNYSKQYSQMLELVDRRA